MFSFGRARAKECVEGTAYGLTPDSAEDVWFKQHVLSALAEADYTAHSTVAVGPMVAAFAQTTAEELQVVHVKYGQLKLIAPRPTACELPAPFDDLEYEPEDWESYAVGAEKRWCLGHDHYKELSGAVTPFTFEVLVMGNLETFEETESPCVRIQMKKLPTGITYTTLKYKQSALKIEYGEFSTRFETWNEIIWVGTTSINSTMRTSHSRTLTIVDAMTKIACWPMPAVAPQELASDEDERPIEDKLELKNRDHQLCVLTRKGKEEMVWQPVTNFAIVRVVTLYTYEDREANVPSVRLLCTHRLHTRNEDIQYVTPEDNPEGEGQGMLHVEVIISGDAKIDALKAEFKKADARLNPFKLTLELFDQHLRNLEKPVPSLAITYFGKLEKRDLFVMSNGCFGSDGVVLPLETKNIAMLPRDFNGGGKNLLPWPQDQWPTIYCIEKPHIRYALFVHLWNDTFPKIFLNNEMAAKCAFALAIMHLHSDRFWAGQALKKVVPAGWLKSVGAYTGKTQIQVLINALLGLDKAGLFNGGMSSEPHILGKLSQQSCMSLQLDELVTKDGKNKASADVSSKVKNLAMLTYECSMRGKLNVSNSQGSVKPRTSWIGSANLIPNEKNPWMWQRTLLIIFQALEGDAEDNVQRSLEVGNMTKVISSLLPDLYGMLHEGKLDPYAIEDCHQFVQAHLGEKAGRNGEIWGTLLYYLLNLAGLAQGMDDKPRIFEFVCDTADRQHDIAQRFTTTLDQFIIEVYNCLTACASNPLTKETESIFLHNYRTDIKPPGLSELMPQKWYSFKLEAICNVLHNVMRVRFTSKEILTSVQESKTGATVILAKGRFYNLRSNPWPIATVEMDVESNKAIYIPLKEEELDNNACITEPALFIEKKKFDGVIEAYQGIKSGGVDDRYKHVMIYSSNKEFNVSPTDGKQQPYNFYEVVCAGLMPGMESIHSETGWFGFRVLLKHPFSPYLGYTNAVCLTMYDYVVEREHLQSHLPPISEMFKPGAIVKYYAAHANGRMSIPCYERDPFIYRNGPDDTLMPLDRAVPEPRGDLEKKAHSPNRKRDAYVVDKESGEDDDDTRSIPTPGSASKKARVLSDGVSPVLPPLTDEVREPDSRTHYPHTNNPHAFTHTLLTFLPHRPHLLRS